MTDQTPRKAATGTIPDVPPRRRPRIGIGEFGTIWVGLLALVPISALLAPGTLRPSNVAAMLPFAGVLAIAAAGQTLVMRQRGLDLSQPGAMTICAFAVAKTQSAQGLPAALAVALLIAVAIGLVNGLLVTRLSVTPLIATLAVNSLVMGGVWSYSNGLPVATSAGLTGFARAERAGVPALALIAAGLVAVLTVLANRTAAGRRFTVVGASPATARAAGIRAARHQVGGYVASAVCAGAAGVLLAGFTGSATTTLGAPYLVTAIAAVVVGGTPFTGGRGSLVATAAAALFLSQLGQITLALGAPTSTQLFVQAAALVMATALRRLPPLPGRRPATAAVSPGGAR
ncbi:ABC transporter permease [Actinomadura sp. B10D3]|uniref:ABC transporter permease n=1 Tax=Actinomadura sp. B10D3 TaxID=3153557 RepID=UPI00325D5D7A